MVEIMRVNRPLTAPTKKTTPSVQFAEDETDDEWDDSIPDEDDIETNLPGALAMAMMADDAADEPPKENPLGALVGAVPPAPAQHNRRRQRNGPDIPAYVYPTKAERLALLPSEDKLIQMLNAVHPKELKLLRDRVQALYDAVALEIAARKAAVADL